MLAEEYILIFLSLSAVVRPNTNACRCASPFMKSLFLLLGLMFSCFCFAQHDSTVVSKAQVREFLQTINLPGYRLVDKPSTPPGRQLLSKISSFDKLFDSADIDFMERQRKAVEEALWDSTYVATIEIAKADSIFKTPGQTKSRNEDVWTKKSGMRAFYRLSFPLFSKDFNYCIINVEYRCGGLCGEGSTNIYQRTEKGWMLKKKLRHWVS